MRAFFWTLRTIKLKLQHKPSYEGLFEHIALQMTMAFAIIDISK